MPISLDKKRGLTERQRVLIEGIKKGIEEGKTNKEIAEELSVGVSYIMDLRIRGGLTKKKGSEVRTWIENNKEIKDWLREIRGGEAHDNTKNQFATFLRKYCIFRGLSPAELLDEAEEDLKRDRSDKEVKGHLLDFRDYLKEGGRSKNTIASYFTVINSYFSSCDVPLPKLSNVKREIENHKKEFDRERVKLLINACNPQEKAIFLTMFQSGLAANEISNLQIKDMKEEKDGITILRLRREKTGVNFITFIGRDGRRGINEYLNIRNQGNLMPTKPNISKAAKVVSEESYLFTTYDSHTKRWNKINSGHISRYMLSVCKRLGWINNEKRNPYRSHALRASFASILNNNGVPKNFIDYMLGHKPSNVDGAYFKQHFNRLFKYYQDNEHLLSLSNLEKIPDSKYEELKIEMGKRDKTIQGLKNKIEGLEIVVDSLEEGYENMRDKE